MSVNVELAKDLLNFPLHSLNVWFQQLINKKVFQARTPVRSFRCEPTVKAPLHIITAALLVISLGKLSPFFVLCSCETCCFFFLSLCSIKPIKKSRVWMFSTNVSTFSSHELPSLWCFLGYPYFCPLLAQLLSPAPWNKGKPWPFRKLFGFMVVLKDLQFFQPPFNFPLPRPFAIKTTHFLHSIHLRMFLCLS